MRKWIQFFILLFTVALAAQAPPSQFPNADRQLKLTSAFPEVDRIFNAYVNTPHIPGSTWGIVIDGVLVYVDDVECIGTGFGKNARVDCSMEVKLQNLPCFATKQGF